MNNGTFYGRLVKVMITSLALVMQIIPPTLLFAQGEKKYPLDEIENPIAIRLAYNNSNLKGKLFKNNRSISGFDFGAQLITRPDESSVIETGLVCSLRGFRFFNQDTVFAPSAIQIPRISGSTRLYMLDFPFMTHIRLNTKLKLMLGGALSLKYLSRQEIKGEVKIISADSTFSIPIYNKGRNNAIDLLDLSAMSGIGYHITDKLEFRAQAHIDLLGLNTGEIDGFSRSNNQRWVTVSLVYWLGEFMDFF
jgi:hypothetical protein